MSLAIPLGKHFESISLPDPSKAYSLANIPSRKGCFTAGNQRPMYASLPFVFFLTILV
jgi:hypothetical protein